MSENKVNPQDPHTFRYTRLSLNLPLDSTHPVDLDFYKRGASRVWRIQSGFGSGRVKFRADKELQIDPSIPRSPYDPANRCIYCSNSGPHSEEHIIPKGFGSTVVLRNASCHVCRDHTGGTEQSILRTVLWASRRQLKLKTRKRAKEKLPDPLMISSEERISFSLEDHPTILMLPIFHPPGIFQGRAKGTPGLEGMWGKNLNLQKELLDKLKPRELSYQGFDNLKFCQVLAKISHSFLCAELKNTFKPTLLDFILRRFEKDEHWLSSYDWVGGSTELEDNSKFLHEIAYGAREINDQKYLMVRLRLFASLGAPTYNVLAGELPSSQKQKFFIQAKFANTLR